MAAGRSGITDRARQAVRKTGDPGGEAFLKKLADSDPIIRVRGLTKSYGSLEAVRGIDFEVRAGEVFGLLGPNGAGKTTTVEILEGLRPRTSGEVAVLRFDPATQSAQLKDQVGVCLQSTNLPDKIRVVEAMELFASFHSRSLDIAGLLGRLQLWEQRPSVLFDAVRRTETATRVSHGPA